VEKVLTSFSLDNKNGTKVAKLGNDFNILTNMLTVLKNKDCINNLFLFLIRVLCEITIQYAAILTKIHLTLAKLCH